MPTSSSNDSDISIDPSLNKRKKRLGPGKQNQRKYGLLQLEKINVVCGKIFDYM